MSKLSMAGATVWIFHGEHAVSCAVGACADVTGYRASLAAA